MIFNHVNESVGKVQNAETLTWLVLSIVLMRVVDAPMAFNVGFIALTAVKMIWSGMATKVALKQSHWYCFI